jgi:hypothetical protein
MAGAHLAYAIATKCPKIKIHSDNKKCPMKRLGPISSSLCVVHIIGRRVSEEMIHSTQVITVKSRYDRSIDLTRQFKTAERYYEHLLGKIIEELITSREGQEVVCTVAQLYYEDWSITSMQKLRETDKNLHGRDGYLVSELIRKLVQIRFGELTSEEAKAKPGIRNDFSTQRNLVQPRISCGSWPEHCARGVSKLINLSPMLTEALLEIEGTIQKIRQIRD